jgi:hypothetical protein
LAPQFDRPASWVTEFIYIPGLGHAQRRVHRPFRAPRGLLQRADGPDAGAAGGPGRVVGLFNTAILGLRAGSGITVGVLGALINVHWSLALSAAAVVVTAGGMLAADRQRRSAR